MSARRHVWPAGRPSARRPGVPVDDASNTRQIDRRGIVAGRTHVERAGMGMKRGSYQRAAARLVTTTAPSGREAEE